MVDVVSVGGCATGVEWEVFSGNGSVCEGIVLVGVVGRNAVGNVTPVLVVEGSLVVTVRRVSMVVDGKCDSVCNWVGFVASIAVDISSTVVALVVIILAETPSMEVGDIYDVVDGTKACSVVSVVRDVVSGADVSASIEDGAGDVPAVKTEALVVSWVTRGVFTVDVGTDTFVVLEVVGELAAWPNSATVMEVRGWTDALKAGVVDTPGTADVDLEG